MLTIEFEKESYASCHGVPSSETPENLANEFLLMSDALTWSVVSATFVSEEDRNYSDVVRTILHRDGNGAGGGIPLTRGEVAMLFLDGYAGDGPGLLDIRSQGYGEDDDWDGLNTDDVMEDEDTAFVWLKWEPLELWPD